eukprot:CAMPEP_0196730190 /NCGR_PEP_ID=MMETSP1091-20130531/10314_1 /TAXON_ID=302021 /ORGANISM="Rhodomonas sp., Strain CCMP768" /LENGTH=150 /DNA_ID=CAMNT_0042073149 /DNA_START=188 /DNA_END=636 /DNA_ORIENTATION=+
MLLARSSFDARVMGSFSLAACLFLARMWLKRRALPPICDCGIRSALTNMSQRGKPPQWLLQMRRMVKNSVFRIPLPTWNHVVIVSDSDVARAILTHSKSEKPSLYKSMRELSQGTENMFTKRTHGEGWDWARKGCAHAFTSFRVSAITQA